MNNTEQLNAARRAAARLTRELASNAPALSAELEREEVTVKPITDRDMKDYIRTALSVAGSFDDDEAHVCAIFESLHTVYGLIDLDTLTPETFWTHVERVDAQLAAAAETEPSDTRSMIELIEAYASGTAVHGGPYSDDEERVEIDRRLELIQRYGGTEASNIKAILQTGRPLDGWLSDEVLSGDGGGEAIGAEIDRQRERSDARTELRKLVNGEPPYESERPESEVARYRRHQASLADGERAAERIESSGLDAHRNRGLTQ